MDFTDNLCYILYVAQPRMEKYPSWLKGLPWKGSRSLVAARGFKSLLLRLEYFSKIFLFFKEKIVDMPFVLCYI